MLYAGRRFPNLSQPFPLSKFLFHFELSMYLHDKQNPFSPKKKILKAAFKELTHRNAIVIKFITDFHVNILNKNQLYLNNFHQNTIEENIYKRKGMASFVYDIILMLFSIFANSEALRQLLHDESNFNLVYHTFLRTRNE